MTGLRIRRAANDSHETVAVSGGACFRSTMALDHAGLASAKNEPTASVEEKKS